MSQTWVIGNQKGGVGKTTTVVSLAGVAAQRGQRVLVIDLDPHGSLTSYFRGDDANTGLTDVFRSAAEGGEPSLLGALQSTAFENISLIGASMSLATIERRFGQKPGMGLVIDQALAPLRDRYDLILIDCPPILGMLLVNGLATADMVIVPVQTDPLALVGLKRLDQTLEMMARNRLAVRQRFVVPTMFDRRTRSSWDTLVQLKSGWREHLWWEVVPVDTQLREASRRGVPVAMLGTNSRAAQAYERLFDDINEQLRTARPRDVVARAS